MPRRARPLSSTLVKETHADFSGGIIGGHSDIGVSMKHLRYADNVEFDPIKSISVRKGYRDINGFVLADEPHTLMMFYGAAGATKTFVAAADKIYEVTTSGYTLQSLPFTPASGRRWKYVNLNGALIAVQEGGAQPPLMYDGSSWLSTTLPTPAAPTGTMLVAGGSMDAGTHLYRVRHRFKNGASLASATLSLAVAGPNLRCLITLPAASARSDYLGWTIERTRVGVGAAGPWYFIADGTAATYDDTTSDAANNRLVPTEIGPFGSAPSMEGLVAYRNRVIGWKNSNIYISQEVAESDSSGVFNFNPTSVFPVKADDGDPVQLCLNTPGDQLVILKAMSGHTLTGLDLANFVLEEIFSDVGAAGTRAAVVIKGRVVFYGGLGRLFQVTARGAEPFGEYEVDHYLKKVDQTRDSSVALFNHRGRFLLIAYSVSPDTYNRDALVYNPARRTWTHWRDVRINDALSPKRPNEFSKAAFIFCDPKNVPAVDSPGGGAQPSFVVWNDRRVTPAQKYVQKILSTGQAAWTANGVILSSAAYDAYDVLESDAYCAVYGLPDGGCVVLYAEYSAVGVSSLRVQRLDSAGAKLWGAGGIAISNVAGLRLYSYNATDMRILSDGGSGFFLLWPQVTTADTNQRIFAQRIDSAGTALWAANGVNLAPDSGSFDDGNGVVSVLPDGAGGFYFTYGRYETLTNNNVLRLQRVNSAGALVWAAGGVSPGSSIVLQYHAPVCVSSDGFLTYIYASYTSATVTVRRFNPANGATVWTTVALDPTAPKHSRMRSFLVPGNDGSVLVFWAQNKTATAEVIMRFARIDSAGAIVTAATTIETFAAAYDESGFQDYLLRAVPSGDGGAIVFYKGANNNNKDLYVTKVAADGTLPWGARRTISNIAWNFSVASDGAGGAIVCFDNSGETGTQNVYMSRVRSNGAVQWAAGGLKLRTGSNQATAAPVMFTGAAQEQYPAGTFSGYHVWVGLYGTLDATASDGTGGTPIKLFAETPEIDYGEPDVLKDLERIEHYVRTGSGALNVAVTLDDGSTVTIPVSSSRSSAKWGKTNVAVKADTMIWGPPPPEGSAYPENPNRWGGERVQNVSSGIPNSTVGKRYKLSIRKDCTSEFIYEGFSMDYRPLPERNLVT